MFVGLASAAPLPLTAAQASKVGVEVSFDVDLNPAQVSFFCFSFLEKWSGVWYCLCRGVKGFRVMTFLQAVSRIPFFPVSSVG